MQTRPVIRYRAVHKAFDLPVLEGIDLDIFPGEMFGLFGASGAGKSVLLKTTIGLIVPDRGDVEVDGRSVFFGDRRDVRKIRDKVGYVFQHAALFDSLNVFENVETGLPLRRLRAMDGSAHRAPGVGGAGTGSPGPA